MQLVSVQWILQDGFQSIQAAESMQLLIAKLKDLHARRTLVASSGIWKSWFAFWLKAEQASKQNCRQLADLAVEVEAPVDPAGILQHPPAHPPLLPLWTEVPTGLVSRLSCES